MRIPHRPMGLKPKSHDMRQGHTVAGYACQPGFSPDGRYVISGDGEGKLWFWDWKTCKPYRTIKAHEGVCIGAAWHPMETSKARSSCWVFQCLRRARRRTWWSASLSVC